MKTVIRYFFKILRAILGPFLLFGHWLTRPKGVVRSDRDQQAIDMQTQQLALYHFPTCPFCLKVRRAIRRQSLKITLRNAQHDPVHRNALLAGGGKIQTPCLQISDTAGKTTWMYESDAILAYLKHTFGS